MISGSIVFILIARYISQYDLGLISFGVSLAGIIAAFSEFGFSIMALRDIPQKTFDIKPYVSNSLIVKFILSLLVFGLSYIYLSFLTDRNNFEIGIVFVLQAIVSAFVNYYFAIFKAKNRFKLDTNLSLLYSALLIVIFFVTVRYKLSVFEFSVGILIAKCLQFLICILQYKKVFGPLRFLFNLDIQRYLLNNSWSFGLNYILGITYFSIDTQMLTYFKGNEEVAIYQSLFRVLTLIIVFGDIITQVFLPYFARLIGSDSKKFETFGFLFLKLMSVLGLIVVIFINFFSEQLLQLLYGDKYLAATILALPLSLVLFLRIYSNFYSISLSLMNNNMPRVLVSSVSLVANVLLNFLLIPRFGVVGAAWTSVLTHLIALIIGLYYTKREFGMHFSNGYLICLIFVGLILSSLPLWMTLNQYLLLIVAIFWSTVVILSQFSSAERLKLIGMFKEDARLL